MSNDVASSTVKVENKTVTNQNKIVLFCFTVSLVFLFNFLIISTPALCLYRSVNVTMPTTVYRDQFVTGCPKQQNAFRYFVKKFTILFYFFLFRAF